MQEGRRSEGKSQWLSPDELLPEGGHGDGCRHQWIMRDDTAENQRGRGRTAE